MKNLATITEFSTKKTGYGHWLITMTLQNPNLLLDDKDFYWSINDRNDEPEYITIRKTTTDSISIDNDDNTTLAIECLKSNDINIDLVGLTTL